MSANIFEITFRRVLIVALIGASGFGIWRLASGQTDGFARAENRLAERMDEYVALRMEDDQESIYQMLDPEQRKIKNLRDYLQFYGSGILKPISFEFEPANIDPVTQSATAVLNSTVQLVPERLPKPFDTLQEEHEEHLRKTGSDELRWVWREGEWYLRMQREFITGKAPDGRAVQAIAPEAFPKR